MTERDDSLPTTADYRAAYDAQSACNLSGIVHSFSAILPRIWNEARAKGQGTDYVNTHPISRLFAEQIAHLSGTMGGEPTEATSFHRAYETCKQLMEPQEQPCSS